MNTAPDKDQFLKVFGYFLSLYPLRSMAMVTLMVIAGAAEGVGVLTLVPILEIADSDGATSQIGQTALGALRAIGIEPTLGVLLGIVVSAITLKAGLLYLALRQIGYTTANIAKDLRLRVLHAVLHAKWGHFGRKSIGSYSTTITGETNRTSAAYREACQIIAVLVQVAAYLILSALLSWQLTVGVVFVAVVLTGLFRRFFRDSRSAGAAQTRHQKALNSRLIDVLQGLKPLKAMGKESLVWPLLAREVEGLNEAQKRQVLASETRKAIFEPVLTAVLALGLYAALGLGEQSLPEVLVVAFVFYRLMQNVNNLQMRFQVLATGEAAFWSVRNEVEEAEEAVEIRTGAAGKVRLSSVLTIRDLHFSYGNLEILRGVDLDIPAGAFVALTGESGSGKTTLADLIVGLREPDRGEIRVDGRLLHTLGSDAWRSTIGYVPQELLLFNDTVYRNVTLGDESISEEEVERALRLADAWQFVSENGGGLQRAVGQGGGSLSGGQRQRIGIARALVFRPSLLILDEVTSALDPETEQAICDTLRSLAGEVTILAISHQPALREVADVAYLLRNCGIEPISSPAPVA